MLTLLVITLLSGVEAPLDYGGCTTDYNCKYEVVGYEDLEEAK